MLATTHATRNLQNLVKPCHLQPPCHFKSMPSFKPKSASQVYTFGSYFPYTLSYIPLKVKLATKLHESPGKTPKQKLCHFLFSLLPFYTISSKSFRINHLACGKTVHNSSLFPQPKPFQINHFQAPPIWCPTKAMRHSHCRSGPTRRGLPRREHWTRTRTEFPGRHR